MLDSQKRVLIKPDGRRLCLYGREPLSERLIHAPVARYDSGAADSHLRWHPLRGEWVAYKGPGPESPVAAMSGDELLAPTRDPRHPTELPAGEYDIATFEDPSPPLSEMAHASPELIVPTRPGFGVSEVVVYSQEPGVALGRLELTHLELLIEVWGERTDELGEHDHIHYVLPLENRMGEALGPGHRAHGQIYAYPHVPPVPERIHLEERSYFEKTSRALLSDLIKKESETEARVLYENESAIAFVPVCARYPYEVWVAPKRSVPFVSRLNGDEIADLALALKAALLKYEGLWQKPFSYLMCLYQAPVDGTDSSGIHGHFEFYPPYRAKDRLKVLGGTELGGGLFVNESLPEEAARELREVEVKLD